MERFAGRIIVLWGWRRLAVAFLAGATSALSMAPIHAFPVLFLTLPVFVWLIDGATPRDGAGPLQRLAPAAAVGWWFGFGYFLAGLWWLGAAFLVDGDQFAWLMPFAVVALPAGLALFHGLGAALARAFWSEGWTRVIVFALAMATAEWLRGHVLTGFPWNAFGYALTPTPLLMQSAAVVGLWGLTLAAFLIFAAPAALTGAARGRTGALRFVGFASLLFVAHVGYGFARLPGGADPTVSGVTLRIVQPAIDQGERWQTENEDAIVRTYLELSDSGDPGGAGVGSASLLIWPESAFPFLVTQRPDVLSAIATLLPEGTTLITGAARGEPATGDRPGGVFNSVYVIREDGEIIDAYDKVHLVPFGEYLPFRTFFDAIGIRQLISLPGGFAPGSRRQTLALAGAPSFGPLICYEIIFAGEALDPNNRPGWLLNLTNDAWFGETPGPYQHFHQARVRAVEEGLPLVRAANSGISAIVDAHGRVLDELGVARRGIVDGPLPASLSPTLYARFGDWLFLALVLGGIVTLFAARLSDEPKHN